jgi:nitrate/nitrite-specific signal transduction histidine kinase
MSERAQRIGAKLEVLSRPGHGSSMVLTLAQAAAAQAQTASAAPLAALAR